MGAYRCLKIRASLPETILVPIPKVLESDESFVIPYVAPESLAGVPKCGNLNIAALPSAAVCDIQAI